MTFRWAWKLRWLSIFIPGGFLLYKLLHSVLRSIHCTKNEVFTKRFFGKLNHINRSLQSPVIIRSPVMTNAYNNWGDIGSFPECFKTAEAIPTYKKGKPIEKTNYRPISILSNISTIYERLMHDNMGDYFNDVWVRLLYLIKTWRKTCDNHGVFAAVMTGLSKAFDCISHMALMNLH